MITEGRFRVRLPVYEQLFLFTNEVEYHLISD